MIVDGLRVFLMAGLLAHKTVWEVLKRRYARRGGSAARPGTAVAPFLKGVKLVIFAGLVAQTLLPDVLPIAAQATPLRAVGVGLFALGLIIAILGRLQLGANWADIEAAQVLPQQAVVETGIYAYVRHPIYGADLVLLLGFELALNSWLVLGVGALVPYVIWRVVREERMLSRQLPGYGDYCGRTWRFVPYVV